MCLLENMEMLHAKCIGCNVMRNRQKTSIGNCRFLGPILRIETDFWNIMIVLS
jgi:hypothetical protein